MVPGSLTECFEFISLHSHLRVFLIISSVLKIRVLMLWLWSTPWVLVNVYLCLEAPVVVILRFINKLNWIVFFSFSILIILVLSLVIFSHSLPCFLCAAKLGVRMLCYVPSYFASLSASPAVSLSLITSCVYLSTQFSSVPCCVLPHMTFCVIIIYCCVLGFCFCTFGSSPAL